MTCSMYTRMLVPSEVSLRRLFAIQKNKVRTLLRIFLILNLTLISCSQNKKSLQEENTSLPLRVPETIVQKSALEYNYQTSTWTLDDLPYSGYALTYYSDNTLKEKFEVLEGKKQNKFVQWFPDGHLKTVSNYHSGKLHGEKKIWTQDSTHVLIAHLNYQNGKPHGEQKKWYPTGELFKKLNLNSGKEDGLQQAFRRNGDLYANYEARDGRIFGLKKSALCYSLIKEEVQVKED